MTSFRRMMAATVYAATLLTGPAGAAERETIDPATLTLTFDESFDALDVSSRGPDTRWTAHVPWANGDFGAAAFADPEPGFPFTTQDGILRIEMRKDEDGKWRSGLLASIDADGRGFSQQYGYFEMRAKLPEGPGVWPAFWLVGLDRSELTSEIDVLEHYGALPNRFTSTVHVWNRDDPKKTVSVHKRTQTPPGLIYETFNDYGVLVDKEWIRFYFNRKLVWQTKTPPSHNQPMYMLLNLAAGSGWPIDKMASPSFMYVDYVRAYRE